MRTALDIATEFAPDRAVDLELVILRHMEHHMEVERDACAAKAREFAQHYPVGSDGRNTFILLAEHIERRGEAAE